MTAPRRDGGGTPFGEWVRRNKKLDSRQENIAVTDLDFVFHKFITPGDRMGTRDVQLMLDVEVKTFGARMSDSQRETLFFRHQQLYDKREKLRTIRGKMVGVWSFGVNVLELAGDRPRNGDLMRWGIFASDGSIIWHRLDWVADLEDILSFKNCPDRPHLPLSFRRHRKTQELIQDEVLEIGLVTQRIIRRRS